MNKGIFCKSLNCPIQAMHPEHSGNKPTCKKCGRKGIALNDGICMRCGLPLADIDKFLIEAIKNKGFYYAGDDYMVKKKRA